jgi:galactitol-specific phosphotransferase system IIB component
VRSSMVNGSKANESLSNVKSSLEISNRISKFLSQKGTPYSDKKQTLTQRQKQENGSNSIVTIENEEELETNLRVKNQSEYNHTTPASNIKSMNT